MTNLTTKAPVYKLVACPACGAAKGLKCRTMRNSLMVVAKYTHNERRTAAQENTK